MFSYTARRISIRKISEKLTFDHSEDKKIFLAGIEI